MNAASQYAPDAEGAPKGSPKPPSSGPNLRLLAVLLVAGGVVGGLIALTIDRRAPTAPATLQAVTRANLDNAILSMDPSAGKQAADEARQCKAPLAYVTLQAEPGPAPLAVRIRSGGNLSPSILLTNAPRQVAIPYPAPYLTGQGELYVEGALRPVTIWLTPGWIVGTDPASARIPVVWVPANPC